MEKGNKNEIPVPKPKRSMMGLMIVGSVVATVYIWSLPLLADWGYANPGNAGMSNSGQVPDIHSSLTLSGYISSTPAAGGFAATFFLPIMFIW